MSVPGRPSTGTEYTCVCVCVYTHSSRQSAKPFFDDLHLQFTIIFCEPQIIYTFSRIVNVRKLLFTNHRSTPAAARAAAVCGFRGLPASRTSWAEALIMSSSLSRAAAMDEAGIKGIPATHFYALESGSTVDCNVQQRRRRCCWYCSFGRQRRVWRV